MCLTANTLVVLVSLLTLWCLQASMKSTSVQQEGYDASRAYQNNVQPFYLSPQAVGLWTKPGLDLCNSRVAVQCKDLPVEQRVGCVQKNLLRCELDNRDKISTVCKASVPSTICKRHCQDPNSPSCRNCTNIVLAQGVCSTPDFFPY